jgi:hypothetical protein
LVRRVREITSYWFDVLREITSYWFDVQKRANFKQLVCATWNNANTFSMEQEITHYSRDKLHVGQITEGICT